MPLLYPVEWTLFSFYFLLPLVTKSSWTVGAILFTIISLSQTQTRHIRECLLKQNNNSVFHGQRCVLKSFGEPSQNKHPGPTTHCGARSLELISYSEKASPSTLICIPSEENIKIHNKEIKNNIILKKTTALLGILCQS